MKAIDQGLRLSALKRTTSHLRAMSPQERVAYATHLAVLERFRAETETIQFRVEARNAKRAAWDERERETVSLEDL